MDFEERAKDLWWLLENCPPSKRIGLIKHCLEDAFDEGADYGYDNSPRNIEVK